MSHINQHFLDNVEKLNIAHTWILGVRLLHPQFSIWAYTKIYERSKEKSSHMLTFTLKIFWKLFTKIWLLNLNYSWKDRRREKEISREGIWFLFLVYHKHSKTWGPRKCTDFTISYLQKYCTWRLQIFYINLSWAENSILKNLMWLTHSIEILVIFENQQILSFVIISKITSKMI